MSDTFDRGGGNTVRSLKDAIRRVRTAEAERSDVVVELRDAERARLEMLADELRSVFAEIPAEHDAFVRAVAPMMAEAREVYGEDLLRQVGR